MGKKPLCFTRLKVLRRAEYRGGCTGFEGLCFQAGEHALDGIFYFIGVEDCLDIHLIKHVACLRRVEHITGFIDAEFFENDRKLLYQNTELEYIELEKISRKEELATRSA